MRPVLALVTLAAVSLGACRSVAPEAPRGEAPWEKESPLLPLPSPPLGLESFDLGKTRVKLSPEKVRLGRWLFFDPRLSKDGTVSCASCHDPKLSFSDRRPRSLGVGGSPGTRKSQPIVNAAFGVKDVFFWDGRANTLAEQAKGPITNPVEMANTMDAAVGTVAGVPGYRRAFREAFGSERVDAERLTEAIEAYETTRLSGGSAYDRFQAGDEKALSPLALTGMDVFFGRGRCNACHLGPSFTDSAFHNVGIGYEPAPGELVAHGFKDPGRYGVTHEPADTGAFKTPTLRDVTKRAPYMHDGSSPDLADAVLRYFAVADNPWLDPVMREVRIFPFDVRPLVAFMEALDGTGAEDAPPKLLPQ